MTKEEEERVKRKGREGKGKEEKKEWVESEGEVRRMGKQGERKKRKGAAIVMEEREGKWCLVGKTERWRMSELEG